MSVPSLPYKAPRGVGQFWLGLASAIGSSIALAILVGLLTGFGLVFSGAGPETQQTVTLTGAIIVALYAVYAQISVAVKRCHAVGRSGWWCLVLLIPVIGPLWLLADLSIRPLVATSPPG